MGLQRHHLLPAQMLLHRDRIKRGASVVLRLRELGGDVVLAEKALQACDGLFNVAHILGHHHRIERRPGVDQGTMSNVEDQAAQRRQTMDADTIAVGELDEFLVPDNLEVIEPHRDHRQYRRDEYGEDGEARLDAGDRARLLAAVVITPARHAQAPREVEPRTRRCWLRPTIRWRPSVNRNTVGAITAVTVACNSAPGNSVASWSGARNCVLRR